MTICPFTVFFSGSKNPGTTLGRKMAKQAVSAAAMSSECRELAVIFSVISSRRFSSRKELAVPSRMRGRSPPVCRPMSSADTTTSSEGDCAPRGHVEQGLLQGAAHPHLLEGGLQFVLERLGGDVHRHVQRLRDAGRRLERIGQGQGEAVHLAIELAPPAAAHDADHLRRNSPPPRRWIQQGVELHEAIGQEQRHGAHRWSQAMYTPRWGRNMLRNRVSMPWV